MLDALVAQAQAAGISAGRLLQYGEPDEVIPQLAAAGGYDLVIRGGKRFSGRYARWTSRDLPGRLDGASARTLQLGWTAAGEGLTRIDYGESFAAPLEDVRCAELNLWLDAAAGYLTIAARA